MIQDFVHQAGNHLYSTIALVVMVVLFISLAIWICSGGRDRYARESRLPLDQNDEAASTGLSRTQS
jgi:hypothetical protein